MAFEYARAMGLSAYWPSLRSKFV
ncbi:protein of unknown function [Pararobbsia alpina]